MINFNRYSWSIFLSIILSLLSFSATAAGLNLHGDLISRLEVEMEGSNKTYVSNKLELHLDYRNPESAFISKIEVSDDGDDTVSLSEVYAEMYFQSMDLTIGKQQIAWGKADGINPTDYFNPEDLTDPFAEENKINVPAIRTEYYYQDWIFDLVWAPEFTAPEFPEPGDRWSTFSTGTMETILPAKEVENSELGIRASKWTPEIDFSVSIFRGFSKEPVFSSYFNKETETVDWQAEFYRVTALGGDFARDFGSFVFRGEGAYFIPDNKYEELKNLYYQIVFGVDKDLTDKIYINTQYYREKEEDREPLQMLNFSTEYEITAFKNIELNGSYIWDDGDFVFNPVYKVDVMDNVTVSIGAYVLDGDRGTTYGTYTDKDYCYIELQRSF